MRPTQNIPLHHQKVKTGGQIQTGDRFWSFHESKWVAVSQRFVETWAFARPGQVCIRQCEPIPSYVELKMGDAVQLGDAYMHEGDFYPINSTIIGRTVACHNSRYYRAIKEEKPTTYGNW